MFQRRYLWKPPAAPIGNMSGKPVYRVQFNLRGGGFVVTVDEQGKLVRTTVPNDKTNPDARWVLDWILAGNFPEDPNPPGWSRRRYLFWTIDEWKAIGGFLVTFAAFAASVAAVATFARSL